MVKEKERERQRAAVEYPRERKKYMQICPWGEKTSLGLFEVQEKKASMSGSVGEEESMDKEV